MVHDKGLHTNLPQEGVVNSVSLEDVQLNEHIENRAQSIQSLHSSVDTPTPESAPSYDELQQRLDEYNRHIAQMNEQKNQLQRMHSDAKRHLQLLEQYQRECAERNLSFDDKSKNGEGKSQPPDYDSVDEVQNDMAILSQRVKNITRLVDNQKQLIDQLPGEAGDEIRANQAHLEQKLNDLKRNGNDLHFMAKELDNLNMNAAPDTHRQQLLKEVSKPPSTQDSTRVVPICVAANQQSSVKSIEQKEAEIEAMRMQLRRLKEMMGTIESMETKALPTKSIHKRNDENDNILLDRDRTPTPANSRNLDRERNLRILDNVSSDLRAESERNEVAQERIISLQDHISRCSKQAAAAIQLGEDALKRHSATPTPTPVHRQRSPSPTESQTQSTSELEREYHAKKKEFDEICRRLNATELNGHEKSNAKPSKNETSDTATSASSERTNTKSVSNYEVSSNISDPANCRIENVDKISTAAPPPPPAPPINNINDAVPIDTSSNSTFNSFSIPSPVAVNSGITWATSQPNYNINTFRNPLGSVPTFSMPTFVPQTPISMNFPAPPPATTTTSLPPSTTNAWESSTMMQHCFNQQQVFGQALNQLNTIIWQQQREIEHLHRSVLVLQERLIRLGVEPFALPADFGLDMNYRAESVPPTFNAAQSFSPHLNIASNDLNRAQSEQPVAAHLQQQQQQHYMQQQHHQIHQQRHVNMNSSTGMFSETQQQSSTASAGGSRIYSALNNANVNGQNCRTQSQDSTSHQETVGPAPIFMHHHNNAIHQNNSNLRRANISSGIDSNMLNNQVPPGNRTNNFWDNFRSYSRQNLFSTISNKSNLIDDVDENGADENYPNPRRLENSSLQPIVSHRRAQKRPERNKHFVQQINRRALNESFLGPRDRFCFSFDDNNLIKNIDTCHETRTRLKNFQQRRQQHPNPLSSHMITNPLHANAHDYDEIPFPTEFFDEPLVQPVDELDDQFTAEIYGANYDHPSTLNNTLTRHERNVNFGNSPNNRQENKVPAKFQYRKGQYLSVLETSKVCIDEFERNNEEENSLKDRQFHRGHTAQQLTNPRMIESYCNHHPSEELVEIAPRAQIDNSIDPECEVTSISDGYLYINSEQSARDQFDKYVKFTNRRLFANEPNPCVSRVEKENRKGLINSNIKQRDVCKLRHSVSNFATNESRSFNTPNTRSENLTEDGIRDLLSEVLVSQPKIIENSQNFTSYDTIGACSLAAQNHFLHETQLRDHVFVNDKRLLNQFSKLISNIIESLQITMKNASVIDSVALNLVVKNTVQISKIALNNHEFPEGEEFFILLSHSSWLEMLSAELNNMPTPFSAFLIWYEEYIKRILMNAAYKKYQRKNAKLVKTNKTKEPNKLQSQIFEPASEMNTIKAEQVLESNQIKTNDNEVKTESNNETVDISEMPKSDQAEVSLLSNKKNKRKTKKRKN